MARRSSSVASQTFLVDRLRRESDVDGRLHALDLAQAQEENVFLFVPNLIGQSVSSPPVQFMLNERLNPLGYTRVILAGLSMHYMSTHPKFCTALYSISALLDAVDGQAARALGQTSKFGAVLDMVTDRCVSYHSAGKNHHIEQ